MNFYKHNIESKLNPVALTETQFKDLSDYAAGKDSTMSLNIMCEVEAYEDNGIRIEGLKQDQRIVVKSYDIVKDQVVVTIGDRSFTVVAKQLIGAVERCTRSYGE